MTKSGFKRIRRRLRLSQAGLGLALEISQPYVGRMESGSAPISKRTAMAMFWLDHIAKSEALAELLRDSMNREPSA